MTDRNNRCITVFTCGEPRGHKCDHDGPPRTLYGTDHNGQEYACGETSTCSVCGSSSFDRSWWEAK